MRLWWIIALVAVLLIGGGVFAWYRTASPLGSKADSATALVEERSIAPLLDAEEATVVSRESVELSFPVAGTVKEIRASEGTLTGFGTVLLTLDDTEFALEEEKTRSVLAQYAAAYDRTLAGSRREDLSVTEKKYESARQNVTNTKRSALTAARNAYDQADDAVRHSADAFFTGGQGSDPQLAITVSDTDLEHSVENDREDIEDELSDWKDDVADLKTSSDLEDALQEASDHLKNVRDFLEDVALVLNGATAGGGVTQEELDAWKAGLATSRESVAVAASAVITELGDLLGAKKNQNTAQSELDRTKESDRKEDVAIARERVREVEKQLEIIQYKRRQMELSAPKSGLLVKKLVPEVGEFVPAGKVVAIVEDLGKRIEARVSENTIGLIQVGDPVTVSLRSDPEHTLEGRVESLQPQEVMENDDPFYLVDIALPVDETTVTALRTGMTADILLRSTRTQSVLAVPKSAVTLSSGKKWVTVLRDGKAESIAVEVGQSDNQYVEIKQGLRRGEEILLSRP